MSLLLTERPGVADQLADDCRASPDGGQGHGHAWCRRPSRRRRTAIGTAKASDVGAVSAYVSRQLLSLKAVSAAQPCTTFRPRGPGQPVDGPDSASSSQPATTRFSADWALPGCCLPARRVRH